MTEGRYKLRLLLWAVAPVLAVAAVFLWPMPALFAGVSLVCAKCALELA